VQSQTLPPPLPNAPAPPTEADVGEVLEVATVEELKKAIRRSQGANGVGPEHVVLTKHLNFSGAFQTLGKFDWDNARSVRVRALAILII
jgi:hypothetical protein